MLTKWVIIGTVIIVCGYDILTISQGGVQTSISVILYNYSCANPIIPFAFGLLCGHLFFPSGAHNE
jgi:hypothetical protein